MSELVQATPLTPIPLLPTAAMVPATWVPWPLSSMGSPSLLTKSYPCTSSTKPLRSSSMPLPAISPGLVQTLAARSTWRQSMPVSTTATTGTRLPVVKPHAAAASRSASVVPPV